MVSSGANASTGPASAADERAHRSTLLRSLFDADVVAYQVLGGVSEHALLPEERSFVASAVPKRRREFAAGRLCARTGLAELGLSPSPLRVGERRAPVWPRGAIGSITHTDGFCGAVVTCVTTYCGIGVDAERRRRVDAQLERQILTPDEAHRLRTLPVARREEAATLIFSAKEAFYKCQFGIRRDWLGFHDVTIELFDGAFEVTPVEEIPGLDSQTRPWRGRWTLSAGLALTGIGIRSDGAGAS